MIDFDLLLKTIHSTRETINGLSFDDACFTLNGFNKDETLFDYETILDDNYSMIGTVENENGKPVINDYCLYEVWDKGEQVLAITENEIKEQIERLK